MARIGVPLPRWFFIPAVAALLLLAGWASDARPASDAEPAAPHHFAEQSAAPGESAGPEQPVAPGEAVRPVTLIAHAANGTVPSPVPAQPAPEPPAEEAPAQEAPEEEPDAVPEQDGASGDAGQLPAAPAQEEPQTEPQLSFRNCAEAQAAGAAPLYHGNPGYGTHLDRDGDGVACERG